ncbi:MAG: adenylate kinase [Bacteroidetes bacterium]|nr:adenylate kinase [Bacteroidota bacterium]
MTSQIKTDLDIDYRLVFLGPPGSGKGTQARLLASRFGMKHISTGAILRGEIDAGTCLGIEAKKYIENGQLVPDHLVRSLAENAIKSEDCKGFILDGYPRTIQQALWLCEFMDAEAESLTAVINLTISNEDVVSRLSQRRINSCTGENFHLSNKPPPQEQSKFIVIRSDDQPDAIRQRLKIYHELTHPLVEYYSKKKLLIAVDALGSFGAVNSEICRVLNFPG